MENTPNAARDDTIISDHLIFVDAITNARSVMTAGLSIGATITRAAPLAIARATGVASGAGHDFVRIGDASGGGTGPIIPRPVEITAQSPQRVAPRWRAMSAPARRRSPPASMAAPATTGSNGWIRSS
jgi:hypothetical protein